MRFIKSNIRSTSEGFYLSVGQVSYYPGFVEDEFDIYTNVVADADEARQWFKVKIAEFFKVTEDKLSPLWWWSMPKELR